MGWQGWHGGVRGGWAQERNRTLRKGLWHLIVGRMATRRLRARTVAAARASVVRPMEHTQRSGAREVDVAIGFPPGSWRTVIGRSTWHYLQPQMQSSNRQKHVEGMKALVTSLAALYPCEACRYALGPELESMPPIPTATRKEVVLWWCELHNLVNVDIKREIFRHTMEALDDIYLKNCGDCSAGAPGGGGTISISLDGLGDATDDEDEDEDDEGECCEEGDEDCRTITFALTMKTRQMWRKRRGKGGDRGRREL